MELIVHIANDVLSAVTYVNCSPSNMCFCFSLSVSWWPE